MEEVMGKWLGLQPMHTAAKLIIFPELNLHEEHV
jgi:hypothetical protein